MPPPRTLSQKSALPVARSHLRFTVQNLEAHPLTKNLSGPLIGLQAEWMNIFQTELDLNDQAAYAGIVVVAVDRDLNKIAKRVSKELLTITGDDSSHPLYQHYFQAKPLHVFVRPILGKQLEAMRAWLPSLSASDSPACKALGLELSPLIQQADAAVQAETKALDDLKRFRDIGERFQFINKVNAALKTVYGTLAAMPHDHLGLPSNFAHDFFMRVRVSGEVEDEPTVESLEEEIDGLSAELEAKKLRLSELKTEHEKAAKKLEAKALAEAKRTQLEKELADKQKELDALSRELSS